MKGGQGSLTLPQHKAAVMSFPGGRLEQVAELSLPPTSP